MVVRWRAGPVGSEPCSSSLNTVAVPGLPIAASCSRVISHADVVFVMCNLGPSASMSRTSPVSVMT